MSKLSDRVVALEALHPELKKPAPKFKVGDVCMDKYYGIGKVLLINYLGIEKYRLRYGDKNWYSEKSALTLIPQPEGYGGDKPSLTIGSTFVWCKDGKKYEIVDARVPKRGEDYISEDGTVFRKSFRTSSIRFIVKEVVQGPVLNDGWWGVTEDGKLWRSKYKGLPKPTDIKPATRDDLCVDIKGIKCWFVEGGGDLCLLTNERCDWVEHEEKTVLVLTELAELKHACIICQEQWKAMEERNVQNNKTRRY